MYYDKIRKAVEPVLVRSEMAKRLFKMIIKMNHPNIIRCEYFVDDGIFYVVREYNDDYVMTISSYLVLKSTFIKNYIFFLSTLLLIGCKFKGIFKQKE